MPNELSHKLLVRAGSSSGGATTTPRISADFQIDGESLLQILVREDEGHSDFMSVFVRGFSDFQANAARQLRLQAEPSSGSGRVLLYVCPECGDIGCGAYSAKIARNHETYTWSDFAYENGYEDPRRLENIGPFVFVIDHYEQAIALASAP